MECYYGLNLPLLLPHFRIVMAARRFDVIDPVASGCEIDANDTRDNWFTAGEPIKNAPQDIRIEPNRRYTGVPLPQRGVRSCGTETTSTKNQVPTVAQTSCEVLKILKNSGKVKHLEWG